MNKTIKRIFQLTVIGAALLPIACAAAEAFPTKPLRIVVPAASGSAADANPRFYGDLLSKLWGQGIVVDNRPGANGIIGAQAVKSAAADGYTLLMANTSLMSVNPIVMKDLPYDPVKDFRPVIMLTQTPTAFVAGANSSSRTVKDLIAATKKTGGVLTVGSYTASYELLGTWFGMLSGLTITPVPYKGATQVITDVIGGQIVSGIVGFDGALALIKEGRLRALAITADERHRWLPEVPTMKESGFPEFVNYGWSSIFVRSETPDPVLNKLYEGFKSVMASPEARTYQAAQPGIIVNRTPQEIRAFVAADLERFRKIAQAAGIKPR